MPTLGFDIREAIHRWYGFYATTPQEIDQRLATLVDEFRRWSGRPVSAQEIETDPEAARAFQALRNRMEMAQRPNPFSSSLGVDPTGEFRSVLQGRLYPELTQLRAELIKRLEAIFRHDERMVRDFSDNSLSVPPWMPVRTVMPFRQDPRLKSTLLEAIRKGQLTREELEAVDIITSPQAMNEYDRSILTFFNLVETEPVLRFPPYFRELVASAGARHYVNEGIDSAQSFMRMMTFGATAEVEGAKNLDPETLSIRTWINEVGSIKHPLVSILILMKYGEYDLARKFLKALKATEGTDLQKNIYAMLLMAAAHDAESRAWRCLVTGKLLEIAIANQGRKSSHELRSIFDYSAAVLSTPEVGNTHDTSTLDGFLFSLVTELRNFETEPGSDLRAERGIEMGTLNFLRGYYRLQRELGTFAGRERDVVLGSPLSPLITYEVSHGRLIIHRRILFDVMSENAASRIISEMGSGSASKESASERAHGEPGHRDPARRAADRMKSGATEVVRRRARGGSRRAHRRNPIRIGRLAARSGLRMRAL